MSNYRAETAPTEGFSRPQPLPVDALRPGFVQLQKYPELIPVLTQAVDAVINRSTIDSERDADLLEEVERAAAAAALTTYERMAVSAHQVRDAADEARKARADSVAATAEVMAERVTDAAAEVHKVEEASAAHLVSVAANAASELAASVRLDDESAASAAAALVVKALSEAAAVTASARADAASGLAQAAADAATDVAVDAASTAMAAELDQIANASERREIALEACAEVAAATAEAVLAHRSGADQPGQPPSPRSPWDTGVADQRRVRRWSAPDR